VKLLFTPGAAEDLRYWRSGEPEVAQRVEDVLQQLRNDTPLTLRLATSLKLPFPQLLSVKITPEHRLVFEQLGADIIVHQCRYHY
jgi:toxin YoeB